MAVLNAWQRVDRVLGGKPFGDGLDGDVTLSSNPNTYATVTGNSGQKVVTVGSASFSNGDLVLLHQTQRTNAGQWEFNLVESGGGTTSLTLKANLQNTYLQGAQIIKVPRYKNVTLSGYTIPAWNGTIQGISVIVANSITGGGITGNGKGFRGGASMSYSGEGTNGPMVNGGGINGNGGASGRSVANNDRAGGGGGHATTGGTTTAPGGGGGAGGQPVGTVDLTSFNLGGGGGGGNNDYAPDGAGTGAPGGASLMLIAKTVTLNSAITLNGNVGSYVYGIWGGCGAGGAGLITAQDVILGSNLLSSLGGNQGAVGSPGRIAIHHSGTVTGTSNPTFYDQLDQSLKESGNTGAFFQFL